jgi:hypothetical protein
MRGIMAWFGFMSIEEHGRQIIEALASHVNEQEQLREHHREELSRVIQTERGARIAAENEAGRLRGLITAINHAHGKPAGWVPE